MLLAPDIASADLHDGGEPIGIEVWVELGADHDTGFVAVERRRHNNAVAEFEDGLRTAIHSESIAAKWCEMPASALTFPKRIIEWRAHGIAQELAKLRAGREGTFSTPVNVAARTISRSARLPTGLTGRVTTMTIPASWR